MLWMICADRYASNMMKKIATIWASINFIALAIAVPAVFAEDPSPEPLLRLYAINAGYKDDESSQNYDFIELERLTESELSLASYRIIYTNSAGNQSGELTFSDQLVLVSDRFLLGSNNSPQYTGIEGDYFLYDFGSAGLASTAGKLELYQGEQKIDEVCWGKLECTDNYAKFATKADDNYSLVRCAVSCSDGRLYGPAKYYPDINPESIIEILPEQPDLPDAINACSGVVFSELYSNYQNDVLEQFVELFNPTPDPIILSDCYISYKNTVFPLSGELAPGAYYLFTDENLKLTKDPTSSNIVSLVNGNNDIEAQLEYPHGQKKGTSYAVFDITSETSSFWRQTYQPTPGEPNIYQEFQSCEQGKVINPATGNCIKENESESQPVTCPAGKYLNPLTNRCKTIEAATALTPCKEGYERNPETNRCRKISTSTATDPVPCKEGYERNPETNRCRKIRENTGETTAYAPKTDGEQSYQNSKIFIAIAAVITAILLGAAYIIYQYRREICKIFQNLRSKKRKV